MNEPSLSDRRVFATRDEVCAFLEEARSYELPRGEIPLTWEGENTLILRSYGSVIWRGDWRVDKTLSLGLQYLRNHQQAGDYTEDCAKLCRVCRRYCYLLGTELLLPSTRECDWLVRRLRGVEFPSAWLVKEGRVIEILGFAGSYRASLANASSWRSLLFWLEHQLREGRRVRLHDENVRLQMNELIDELGLLAEELGAYDP